MRVDIEEANNLAAKKPEKTATMNHQLTEMLTEMNASYPYYNPSNKELPGQTSVCTVKSHKVTENTVEFVFKENGAKVVRADLIYTLNGGEKYEEWFRTPATLKGGTTTSVELPAGTTHYYLNLVDVNNFMVSYPEVGQKGGLAKHALSEIEAR